MDISHITPQIQSHYTCILSAAPTQQSSILAIFDPNASLTTPYMLLHSRNEIMECYRALERNNSRIEVKIEACSFDEEKMMGRDSRAEGCVLDFWIFKDFVMVVIEEACINY